MTEVDLSLSPAEHGRMELLAQPGEEDHARPVAEDLARLFSYRLSRLTRLLAREGGKLYAAELGLPLPQWRVLSTLGLRGELGVSAIAEHCAMDRGQTSRTVDQLDAAGLIRQRADRKDRRVTLFSLSPEGEKRYRAGLPLAYARQHALLAGFSAAEIDVFSRMLDRMIARLDP